MIEPKNLIKDISRPSPDSSERSGIYRFDRNERATLFSDSEFKSMLSTLTPYDLVAYGELEPFYLKIAKWLGVDRKNILLSSGSDTGIRTIFETFAETGDEVAILIPTYAMFSVYTKMFGAKEVQWKYNSNLTINIDSFIGSINEKMKIIAIANPNHTGTVIQEEKLVNILRTAEKFDCIVIIDEAYHHFYPGTMRQDMDQFKNMVIVRTFSKAFGVASLRIGLLIANEKMISDLYKVKLVHEITGVAAKIGSYLLDHLEIMENFVKDINKGKDVLYNRLPAFGFEVLRSEANFVFFKMPDNIDPKHVVDELLSKDIHIKGPFNNHPFSGHLRTTAGDEVQMNLLCDEINRIISS